MLGWLPKYYALSVIMQAIMQADGLEFDSLQDALNDILNQFYVDTATWGLSIWESTMAIAPQVGDSDDQRRSVIKSILRGIGTVTIAMIQNVTDAYVNGSVAVTSTPATYSFVITFVDPRGIPNNIAVVEAVIEQIKPAHLAVSYVYTWTLYGELKAWGETYGSLKTMTYGQIKTYKPS
jgi:uncharacterized protein YmfQ (DUF2313 family)